MSLTKFNDRWERLDELFQLASTLPADEVAEFCKRECGPDEELREFLYDLVTAAVVGDDDIRDSVSNLAQEVAHGPSLSGERVGAYQIDELIGRGGMGEVYSASRSDG